MLDILEEAAVAAGKAILDVYHAGPNVSYKADSSPVTDADESADNLPPAGYVRAATSRYYAAYVRC